MKGSELTNVLRKLAALTINAPKKLSPKTMNEEWTKRRPDSSDDGGIRLG